MAAEDIGLPLDGGTLQRLPPNASKEQQTAVINDILDRLNNLLQSQVFSDATSKRFVQGYAPGRWPDGDFGLAISAEGENVLEADFEDLIFAWDFSTNKQYFRGGVINWYDPASGVNYMQTGVLPDGSGGLVVPKEGIDVEDVFD